MATGRLFSKGCVFALGVWLLLMGAYGYVALGKIHDLGGAAVVGVLGGTFSAIFLSSIIGFFTSGTDRAAVRRAAAMEPMKDGRLEAASGAVQALDTPLEAPFSGRPCVAYDYDVKPPGGGAADFAGYAMTPCAVQTLRGPVRVLGWVVLDQFPAATDAQIDRGRGERYLASATLEPMGVTRILSVLGELVADDDGTIRKDYRIDGTGTNVQGRYIQERVLPAGAQVTLLGHWSEARGGFVAKGAAVNRIFNGDLDGTRKQLGGDAVRTFVAASIFFVVLHAILVPAYFFAHGEPSANGAAGSVWDERDCDRQKTKLALRADPNEVGNDAITALMNAARMDEPACVGNLIAAGARLEDRDKWGDTALVQAVTAGRDENVTILLAAGAKDFRITSATGRAIADGDPPLAAVRDYIAAVFRGDFETMARLRVHASLARLEEQRADLPFWQSRLPQTFTVEDAWMTADAATLTIRGTASSGPQRILFHLERQRGRTAEADSSAADVWQIRREWRPDER